MSQPGTAAFEATLQNLAEVGIKAKREEEKMKEKIAANMAANNNLSDAVDSASGASNLIASIG